MFNFIWDHGVGNALDKKGEPQAWTDIGLEDAFRDVGLDIAKRSIQNWHSGKHKPSVANVRALAKIVSGNSKNEEQEWVDALIFALRQNTPVDVNAAAGLEAHDTEKENRKIRLHRMRLIAEIVGLGLLLGFLVNFLVGRLTKEKTVSNIQVTNLKFCDVERFAKDIKTCLTNVGQFPEGVTMVYVSFQLVGAPDGHPFERRWYLNGEQFLEKSGFYDSAWEDYTWMSMPKGFDSGRYDLRIIVDGKVQTGGFFVGGLE